MISSNTPIDDVISLFQTPAGQWRDDSHVGIAWIHQEFHAATAVLSRSSDDETDGKVLQAACRAAAMVKLHTELLDHASAASAQTDADAQRILLLLESFVSDDSISTEKWRMTDRERAAANDIINELQAEFGESERVGQHYAPLFGTLAMPPRRPGIRRRAGALGVAGKLIETSSEELTNHFLAAHAGY
ncbi:MAG: hypothetical protein ACO1TE_30135 [Prosthecobacter sp.]